MTATCCTEKPGLPVPGTGYRYLQGPGTWLPLQRKTRAASGDFESLVTLGEPEYRVGMQPFLPVIRKLVGHSPDKEE